MRSPQSDDRHAPDPTPIHQQRPPGGLEVSRYLRLSRLLCACALCVVSRSSLATPVQLTLDVVVRDENGSVLSGVPIEASTPHVNEFAFTDVNGSIHFLLNADDSDAQILVRLCDGDGFDLPPGEAVHAIERCRQLQNAYAFTGNDTVPLVSGQTSYTCTLVARDAVAVSGRIVDEAGVPRSGSTGVLDSISGMRVGAAALGVF